MIQDIAEQWYICKVKEIHDKFGWPTTGYLAYKLNISKKYAQHLLNQIGERVDISDIPRIPLSYYRKKGIDPGNEEVVYEKEA